MSFDIAGRIADNLRTNAGHPAMEYQHRWWTRGQLSAFADALDTFLRQHDAPQDLAIGLVAHNRPSHVASLIALLASQRPISMLYAFQSPTALAADIATINLGVLIIDELDWSPLVAAAAAASGTLALLLRDVPEKGFKSVPPDTVALLPGAKRRLPGAGIEILSSGTTGAPKRIFHGAEMLFRSLESAFQTPVPSTAPELVFWPLGGIGGNLQVSTAMMKGNSFVLLEKFSVEGAVDAVERHKMPSIALTPTMLRMIYDADVPPARFASLIAFFGGSGPLDPELQDKVESRYGKPVIWAMGATEFCGTAVAWTLDLHREFAKLKRGSAGRALAGCHLRIVDPESGTPLPSEGVGLLEVKIDRMGPEWIRTTDLALIDADGFVFFRGRSDGAIIRGGFKVVPERICEELRRHPGVAEAAVIGLPDERLGHVPVAVIETRQGNHPTAEGLEQHLRARFASPQIPVRFLFVDKLPYTASTKVDLRAVRAIVESSPV